MTIQTQLEQSFAAICAQHDLTCLSVSFHAGELHSNVPFTVYAHGVSVLGSASRPSLGEAIGAAIAELMAKRADAIMLADGPLTVGIEAEKVA